jgi:hypothetical protein
MDGRFRRRPVTFRSSLGSAAAALKGYCRHGQKGDSPPSLAAVIGLKRVLMLQKCHSSSRGIGPEDLNSGTIVSMKVAGAYEFNEAY